MKLFHLGPERDLPNYEGLDLRLVGFDEADMVVDEIRSRQALEKRELREFAILYRTNAQSRAMEEAMRKLKLR